MSEIRDTGVKFADTGDVEAYAADMPEAWGMCRESHHDLKPYDAHSVEDGCWVRIRRCSRCKAKRTDTLDSDFNILHTSYEYAPGYLMKNLGRVSSEARSVFRKANVLREATRKSARKS